MSDIQIPSKRKLFTKQGNVKTIRELYEIVIDTSTTANNAIQNPETAGNAGQVLQLNQQGKPEWVTLYDDTIPIDNTPIPGSDNPVSSGGVQKEFALSSVYDVSEHNNSATFESLSELLSDANLNTLIPSAFRKGGMSIKFVQTSDNNSSQYVQYRYMGTSTADADFTNVTNWQDMDIQKLKYFYYVSGDEVEFTNTRVYIPTLSILKKDGTLWQTLTINNSFTITGSYCLILSSDLTVSIKASGSIVNSDVALLIHSAGKNDWIGGELYEQYLSVTIQTNLETLEGKIDLAHIDSYVYSLSNGTYNEHSVALNAGKVWWINKNTHSWGSTAEITQTFTFNDSTTSFLVLSTLDNTLSIKQIGNILETDVILLQHSGISNKIVAGLLYADYLQYKNVSKEEFENALSGSIIDNAVIYNGSITSATGIFHHGKNETCVLIPVKQSCKLHIEAQQERGFVYCFLKTNNLVEEEIAPFSDETQSTITIQRQNSINIFIPEDANYLYLLRTPSNGQNYLPVKVEQQEYVKFTDTDSFGDNSVSETNFITLRQGGYNDVLNFVHSDTTRISTYPITDGKLFQVNDDYRIEKAVLLDSDMNVVDSSNNLLLGTSVLANTPSSQNRKSWGIDNLPAGYYMVVSFVRADGGIITPQSPVLKNVYDVNSLHLTPILRENVSTEKAEKRSNQAQKTIIKTKAVFPVITGYDTAEYRNVPTNTTCVGLPYGSMKELDKFVPYNVSFKTFMTALNNKRSLIYTEIVSAAHTRSSYGFTYHGTGCASYYGINCNVNAFNVLGLKIPKNTSEIGTIAGMSVVYDSASGNEFDIQNLKPLDIVNRSGHICIISNIYKNRYGRNVIVAFSEAMLPYARTSLYTQEMFLDRLHNGDYNHPATNPYKIYRYGNQDGFPSNNEWQDIYIRSEYIQASYEEVAGGKYNDDICTFAGDEAKFVEGEKVVLNINKGNYTQCEIYKDNVLVNTINLGSDEEIDLDLSSYNLTYGSYKARLKTDDTYSDYTYWNVYSIDLSVDSNKKVTFSCDSRLTPLYFEYQNIAGTFQSRIELSSQDISNGYINTSETFSQSRYIKMFAKTDDGYVITKRIVYNN